MTHEIIEQYLDQTMKTQLVAFDVPDTLIEKIVASVREQMVSCVSHWNDEAFRNALLVIGEEEGNFYLPEADADIRNFVVVTLRNSALESVHADSYNGKRLSPDDIKALTSSAIEYFKNVDFPAMAEQIEPLANDKYGRLARKYPLSWAALSELANSNQQVIQYEPLPVTVKPTLNILKPQEAVSGLFFDENRMQMMNVTADGYSLTIDHGLSHIIKTITENQTPFIGDSFKGVSRNIVKLFAVMEYILGNGLAFITSNYLIANGYIECRLEPLKPGHDLKEMRRIWLNADGLTKNHRGWLKAAADSCH